MKADWIWMPHAGHLCVGNMCQFHLSTYVNGYIVSTVGEYWPPPDVRRIFAKSRAQFPIMDIDENGKLYEKIPLSKEETEALLNLKGDAFDRAYLQIFGFEDLGLDRKYETMVFLGKPQEKAEYMCCPFIMATATDLDYEPYNDGESAYLGHLAMCEKWDKEVHSSQYVEKED